MNSGSDVFVRRVYHANKKSAKEMLVMLKLFISKYGCISLYTYYDLENVLDNIPKSEREQSAFIFWKSLKKAKIKKEITIANGPMYYIRFPEALINNEGKDVVNNE